MRGGGRTPQREKKKQQSLLLSDVSEEMYNRVFWWLKGLCFPSRGSSLGGWGAGGQVGGQPLNPRARPVSTVPAGALTPGAEELLTLPKILPLSNNPEFLGPTLLTFWPRQIFVVGGGGC